MVCPKERVALVTSGRPPLVSAAAIASATAMKVGRKLEVFEGNDEALADSLQSTCEGSAETRA